MESLRRRELAVPLLRGASEQQIRDLRRQPDLQAFVRDPKYQTIFSGKELGMMASLYPDLRS